MYGVDPLIKLVRQEIQEYFIKIKIKEIRHKQYNNTVKNPSEKA